MIKIKLCVASFLNFWLKKLNHKTQDLYLMFFVNLSSCDRCATVFFVQIYFERFQCVNLGACPAQL